jgi:flavin-dependent dehydrogenase
MPPLMNNHGNYIVSLGNVCRWLAGKAEALGVEIYPASPRRLLYDDNGAVTGVVTGDMGVGATASRPEFRAAAWRCSASICADRRGRARLARQAADRKFGLDKGREPQKFGIGLKELWQVKPEKHKPGLVQHSFGWPLDMKTGGGSFLYHWRTTRSRSASSSTSTTRTRICRPSRSSSASRRIPRSAAPSRAASASPTARAPSPRAAGSRCRSCPSRAAR